MDNTKSIKMLDLKFDRGKPFYPFIMMYISSIHGFMELISRHIHNMAQSITSDNNNGAFSREDIINRMTLDNNPFAEVDKYMGEIITNNLKATKLMGELNLKSLNVNSKIYCPVDELASEVFYNGAYLMPHTLSAGCSLLVTCFEITKDPYQQRDELWNFFYHCRNAAAHGGKFNITNQTRFPAKWGNMEITANMNGKSLFQDSEHSSDYLLAPGDPLNLLYDIENTYIV